MITDPMATTFDAPEGYAVFATADARQIECFVEDPFGYGDDMERRFVKLTGDEIQQCLWGHQTTLSRVLDMPRAHLAVMRYLILDGDETGV
jgi:hypothetical protein